MCVVLCVAAFLLGLCVMLVFNRTKKDYEGSIIVQEPEEGKKVFTLEVDGDIANLHLKDSVLFKVKNL